MPCKALKYPFFLLLLLLLTACQSIRSDLTAAEIQTQLSPAVSGAEVYVTCSDRYLLSIFELSDEALPSHACLRDADLSLNEFGVFACETVGEAKEFLLRLSEGLEKRALRFDDRYFTEEKPKFENAKAVRLGRYVLYTVLGESEQNAVIQQFYHIVKGDPL